MATERLWRVRFHLASAAEVAIAAPAVDEQWVRPQDELHHVTPLPAPDPEMMRALSTGTLSHGP
jgi:hypothetical protein